MFDFLNRLHHDERGDAVQFILIAAAVAIPLVVALVAFGGDIKGYLEKRGGELNEKKVETYQNQFK